MTTKLSCSLASVKLEKFLVKDMLYYKSGIPVGTVISGTEGANAFIRTHAQYFYSWWVSSEIIGNFIKRWKKVIQKSSVIRLKRVSSVDPRAYLILDDCLYDKSWLTIRTFVHCLWTGVTTALFIITMQYALGIPPNLRTNIDFTFLLRENIVSNRKRLYEQFAGMFPSFDIFVKLWISVLKIIVFSHQQ